MCQTSEEMSTACKISSENIENNSVYNRYNQNHEITQRDKSHFLPPSRQGPPLYLISEVRDWTAHEEAELSGVCMIEMSVLCSHLYKHSLFSWRMLQETGTVVLADMWKAK